MEHLEGNRLPLIGDTAPAFQALTTKGTVHFPDDYQGKWVLYSFFHKFLLLSPLAVFARFFYFSPAADSSHCMNDFIFYRNDLEQIAFVGHLRRLSLPGNTV